jgi:hypothetical protein
MLALPMLRPLRLVRLLVLMHMINRRATASLRGRVVAYVAASARHGLAQPAIAHQPTGRQSMDNGLANRQRWHAVDATHAPLTQSRIGRNVGGRYRYGLRRAPSAEPATG